MPTKRAVLAELTVEELRANVDHYELEVADRRVKAQLVDALAGSRSARLDEILGDLIIPLPTLAEQGEVAEVLDRIDARLEADGRLVHGLRQAKEALMSVLLTGELGVAPDSEVS